VIRQRQQGRQQGHGLGVSARVAGEHQEPGRSVGGVIWQRRGRELWRYLPGQHRETNSGTGSKPLKRGGASMPTDITDKSPFRQFCQLHIRGFSKIRGVRSGGGVIRQRRQGRQQGHGLGVSARVAGEHQEPGRSVGGVIWQRRGRELWRYLPGQHRETNSGTGSKPLKRGGASMPTDITDKSPFRQFCQLHIRGFSKIRGVRSGGGVIRQRRQGRQQGHGLGVSARVAGEHQEPGRSVGGDEVWQLAAAGRPGGMAGGEVQGRRPAGAAVGVSARVAGEHQEQGLSGWRLPFKCRHRTLYLLIHRQN